MHNCKNAKEALMEAALQGWIPIPEEFAACPFCREEFDSLRGALQGRRSLAVPCFHGASVATELGGEP